MTLSTFHTYMKKYIIGAVLFVAIGGIGYFYFNLNKAPKETLQTYFLYSPEELKNLRALSSRQEITDEQVFKTRNLSLDLVIKNKVNSERASKIYAYVNVAQMDAAYLSYNTKGKFMGNTSPVLKDTLCLFFVADCASIQGGEADEYSIELSKIVLSKINKRIAEDALTSKAYEKKIGEQYWAGTEPYPSLDVGSWKTWLIERGDQFRAFPPPAFGSQEFKNQMLELKKIIAEATTANRKAVVFWAGGPGTKTPPGQWIFIGGDYMREKKIPLGQFLLIRSILAMTIADVTIATFDTKYTYWTKRPFMLDKTMITTMPTPNNPSYLSGSSAQASSAVVILKHFFPENKEKWEAMAKESSDSRTWGGIHFPIDTTAGSTLGQNVGNEVLKKLND